MVDFTLVLGEKENKGRSLFLRPFSSHLSFKNQLALLGVYQKCLLDYILCLLVLLWWVILINDKCFRENFVSFKESKATMIVGVRKSWDC